MRLCAVLLKLCGSVENLTAVHRSVYTAIEGVSVDVKKLDAFEGILTTGHLHWAQVNTVSEARAGPAEHPRQKALQVRLTGVRVRKTSPSVEGCVG